MVKLYKMIENTEILNQFQQNIKEINLHQNLIIALLNALDQEYRLGIDDYLSDLMDRSKNLRIIDKYNDKLKSINSKLSTATHSSNFTQKIKYIFSFQYKDGKNRS